MKLDEIKSKLVVIGFNIEEAVKDAYNKGYLDGLSTKRPSQTQFNKDHASVCAYGEDQEMLVLRGDLSYDAAERKYRQYLETECGLFDGDIGETDDHVKHSNVSYELYEGEPGYYIRSDRGGIYDCWLWELEV